MSYPVLSQVLSLVLSRGTLFLCAGVGLVGYPMSSRKEFGTGDPCSVLEYPVLSRDGMRVPPVPFKGYPSSW